MNLYTALLTAGRAVLDASSYDEDVAARKSLREAVESAERLEIKDWPLPLVINAKAAEKAKADYARVRSTVGGPPWSDLQPSEKQARIQAATDSEIYFQHASQIARNKHESRSPDGDGHDRRSVHDTEKASTCAQGRSKTTLMLDSSSAEAGSEPADSHSLFDHVSAVARREAARVLSRKGGQ